MSTSDAPSPTDSPLPSDDTWRIYGEGWEPTYGVGADFDADASDGVEQAEPGDGPIPRGPILAVPLAFVDGVRRGELGLWAEHPATGARVPGLAGAYAVGSTVIRPGSGASFAGVRVGRLAVWGGGRTGDLTSTRPGYLWASAPIAGTDADACLAHLQDRMRRAEGEVALDAAEAGWNVVLDGPLNRIRTMHSSVAGYVKSHHRRLLPEAAHAQIPGLGIGERTRVHTVGTDRYTCYVRIGHPGPAASPFTGIARLEFAATAGLDAVIVRADRLAATLPTYAGAPHRDERAPVNLTPVRSLERHLSQALGNTRLATRAARDALATGAAA